MILKTLILGELAVNCYILADSRTKEAVIIDPGSEPDVIKKCISEEKLKPLFIINTHGHADHIGANRFLGLPVYIHELDSDFLIDPEKNFSSVFGLKVTSPRAENFLKDGDRLKVGDLEIFVMHTPGHTPGGISLKVDKVLFTGDTLFCEGVGRTDLPYGSEKELMKSISEKILALPDATIIYPGHGPASTIKHERENNPFIC